MTWRRKLEVDGAWWAQARDGSWSVWDQRASDWMPRPDGPPGGASPLQPEGTVVPTLPEPRAPEWTRVAWDLISTFLAVTTPAFFAVLIASIVTVVFTFVWNAFLAPWWGEPIRPLTVFWPVITGVFTFAFCLSVAIVVARSPEPSSKLLAAAIVVAGATGTLFLVAWLTDLGPMQVLTSRTTVFLGIVIALSWGGVALRRWLAEN